MNETEKQIAEIWKTVASIDKQVASIAERLGNGPGKSQFCEMHSETVKQALVRMDNLERTQNRWIGGLAVLVFVCNAATAVLLKLWK